MAKRRKNGEGMIRKRSDGRWEGRAVIGYDDKGLPITKNVLAHTKTESAEKLEKLKEEYRPPSTRCKPDMLFGDWMEFWYENYSKPAIRPLTQQNYENRIYGHIIPEIGKIPTRQGIPHPSAISCRSYSNGRDEARAVPRSAPYLCYDGSGKRHGRENAVSDDRSCVSGNDA